jgi:hypothetical protein
MCWLISYFESTICAVRMMVSSISRRGTSESNRMANAMVLAAWLNFGEWPVVSCRLMTAPP